MKPDSNNIDDYLISDSIINWEYPEIKNTAQELTANIEDEIEKARILFEWVRDNIPHSNDAEINTVTCIASDVLEKKTGICFAKSHLLAALLRSVKIPAGFCYQVIQRDPPVDNRLVMHGLNGIYLSFLDKWIRVDARGNTREVNAQFSTEEEQLAFPMNASVGEFIYDTIYAAPVKNVTEKLMKYKTRTELWEDLPVLIKE